MKILFVLSGIIYALLGLSARMSAGLIDVISFDRALNNYLPQLILVSAVVGLLFTFWFKQAFPNGYAKQFKLFKIVGFPVLFSCVAFGLNQGWLFTINTLFTTQKEQRTLVIIDKRIMRSKRNSSYRLVARDVATGDNFELKVGELKYEGAGKKMDTIRLELKRGIFDIYYAD